MEETSQPPSTNIRALNCEQLVAYLQSCNMPTCVSDAILKHEIDGDSFLGLGEQDLIDLGIWVKLGPRKKVLQMITAQKNIESMPQEGFNYQGLHYQVVGEIPELNRVLSATSALPVIEIVHDKRTDNIEREVNFDLMAILQNDAEGKIIVEGVQKKPPMDIKKTHRVTIVNIVVDYLIAQHGRNPPSYEKHNMAKAIVNCFPSLAFEMDGYPPEYLFFNSSSASFIQTRLNTVRSTMPSETRKRQLTTISAGRKRCKKSKRPGKMPTVRTTLTEDLKSKIAELVDLPPNSASKSRILELTAETFGIRQEQVLSGDIDSGTAFLKIYPRFVDCGNYLIWAEFKSLCPNAQPFDVFVDHFAPRINKLASETAPETTVSDACLKAVLQLVQIHPVIIQMKHHSIVSIVNSMIIFKQENFDVDLFCRSKEEGFLPQLLATGSKEHPFQYYSTEMEKLAGIPAS